jgi:trehalose/maltose hydrolase-like predicted phosphorylase
MSPAVKRTNLELAVHRMLTGERGALMGDALLSVVAAELGDRALVDTLLLPSYDGYLKGPFLQISETPRNNAVSFLTGAGGFLQQVIFGYTGLRIGEGGLVPAFAPVLPSRVTRLVLHDFHARGRRVDVIVDAKGRRIIPAGR